MTRALYRIYNKLRKKQVNRDDVSVVEVTEQFATFHVNFPGLYLTYDMVGHLLLTETDAERKAGTKPLYKPGQAPIIQAEMGSDTTGMTPWKPVEIEDDDVPF